MPLYDIEDVNDFEEEYLDITNYIEVNHLGDLYVPITKIA